MNNKKRILSLDVFRGITVAAMILVNNPGSWGHIYAPLEHAEWNGCTPTDLIFPFFIYIIGAAIAFSLSKRKSLAFNHSVLLAHFTKRALILYGLGLLMALFPYFDFSTVRLAGVLQRISVVYFVASVIFLKTNFKTQLAIVFLLLMSYWIAMTLIPVPGIGFANLNKETNLAAWVDRLILTENHTWKLTRTWDPEGILSTIPAIATCIFGMLSGSVLLLKRNENLKIKRLLVAGTLCVTLGLIWSLVFPLNKSLWTSSYALFTGGLATLFFAFLYWVIDIKKADAWVKPFVVYGVNAITVFFLSGIIARSMNILTVSMNGEAISLKTFLYETYFVPHFSPYNASLAWAIVFVLVWLAVLWLMYKKNIIIKV